MIDSSHGVRALPPTLPSPLPDAVVAVPRLVGGAGVLAGGAPGSPRLRRAEAFSSIHTRARCDTVFPEVHGQLPPYRRRLPCDEPDLLRCGIYNC